jgi:FkbM family methyltransferase
MKSIVNKYLRKINLELHGTGYLQSLAKGEFKKDAFEVQKSLLSNKPVKTIFDVGANRGDVYIRYRNLFPEADVYAFEPFPESYNILTKRHGNDPRLHLHTVAVAEKAEQKDFFVNFSPDTNSLLKPQKTGLRSDEQVDNKGVIKVETITLDSFCEQHKINQIDILKMDIQGGEYAALQGCKKLLSEGRIRLIYSEVYFIEQYEQQPLLHDISKLLHTYGYYPQDIYSPIYGKECIAWADVIFVKRDDFR